MVKSVLDRSANYSDAKKERSLHNLGRGMV